MQSVTETERVELGDDRRQSHYAYSADSVPNGSVFPMAVCLVWNVYAKKYVNTLLQAQRDDETRFQKAQVESKVNELEGLLAASNQVKASLGEQVMSLRLHTQSPVKERASERESQ